jgi:hypothetical protein
VVFALAGVALALSLAHIRYLWFVCDDAYITFRYAANLAGGLGAVFNVGERVEGYTNFLWMLLSALVVRLGGTPEAWMAVVSAGCALATVAAVMLWGSPWAGFLLAASAGFAAWATSGLETALFTMLVTLGYLGLARGIAVGAGLALGLAALTRPEGLLIGACAGVWFGFHGAGSSGSRRAAWLPLALWAACVVPHLLWRFSYYGHWVPNTFAIKSPGLASIAGGLAYLAESAGRLHLYVLAFPLVALVTIRSSARGPRSPARVNAPWELLAAMALPYLAYVATTGGDFMPLYRFVAPMLPLFAIASAAGVVALHARLGSTWGMAIGVVVVVLFGGLNLMESQREQGAWTRGPIESVGLTRRNAANWGRVGERLKDLSQPSDTLATTAAGIIPYVTNLYTIDMLGLVAPDLSNYRRLPSDRPGHTFYLSEAAIMRMRPQFLLGHPEIRPTARQVRLGVDLDPEWRDQVLGPYALLGLGLGGEPPGFVALGVRTDVVERVESAGRSAP